MFDPQLRPVKDRLLAPLARRAAPLHPMVLTAAGLGTGAGAAWAAYRGAWTAALALWVASRVFDGLDGLVARSRNATSDLGGLVDLVADFVVYAAIPIGLAARPDAPDSLALWVAVLLGTFYVNAASWLVPSALLERQGRGARQRGEPTSVTIPESLISGTETVVVYALFFLLPAQQLLLVQIMATLTTVTILHRLTWAVHAFGDEPRASRSTDPTRSNPLEGSS